MHRNEKLSVLNALAAMIECDGLGATSAIERNGRLGDDETAASLRVRWKDGALE